MKIEGKLEKWIASYILDTRFIEIDTVLSFDKDSYIAVYRNGMSNIGINLTKKEIDVYIRKQKLKSILE